MRDFKYRGMTQSRKWLYGIPVKTWWYKTCTWRIIEDGDIYPGNIDQIYDESIIPETISQYTEYKDKNNVEIYEGDKDKRFGEVIFISGCFKCKQDMGNGEYSYTRLNEIFNFEIIGNIHEATP